MIFLQNLAPIDYVSKIVELVINYAPRLILAFVTLFVGLWLIKWILNIINRHLVAHSVDKAVAPFLVSVVGALMRVMLLLSIASLVGIETTSFVAILGAAGLAVGLALQGSLSNFAGGVLILVFKPFRVGDFIEASGFSGQVKEIQIFHTVMVTLDDRTVIIANGALANGAVVNHNTEGTRLVEVTFGVSYANDLSKVKDVLINNNAVKTHPLIIQEGEKTPFVGVLALNPVDVKMSFRVWTKPEHYWAVFFFAQEHVKNTCAKDGVIGALPEQIVHVRNN
ncbi:MAG: mechanosensitive ion channel family protein [Bacteroidetes bacterium]|nr:MAG: mechanosensitive ion channel family protein [Bacteroidota bacterium]TAG87464.1 MAG: mechanosensitive ion channel family protein [Bacteroidota bacterium]